MNISVIFRYSSFLLLLNVLTLNADYTLPPKPLIRATSYMLVDYDTGKILLEKNTHIPRDPASITKVMTAYVVLKEMEHNPNLLEEKVTVSKKAYKIGGSRMFLEHQSSVALKTVLLGLIVQSGNDAAIALAQHIDGTEEAFVVRMNNYAKRLGMNTSHFTNSTGWPDSNHYSSAEDMVKLAVAFIREFPDQYQWFAKKEMTYNKIKQRNRNRLLWRDPTVDGIKTGHTEKAGFCLLASAKRANQRFISVLLGAKSDQERTIQSQQLLDYGFRYFRNIVVQKAEESVLNERVWFGRTEQLNIGFNEDWIVSVPKRISNDVQVKYQIDDEYIKAPIHKGQNLGMAMLLYQGKVIEKRPIYALEEVAKSGFFARLLDHVEYFFVSSLSWLRL